MIKATFLTSMAVVLSAVTAVPALADVPPPADYVEKCTVDKQESASTECLACAAYYGATTRCQTMLEPYCFSKACKSYGASAWTEVYCRSKDANQPIVPTEISSVLASAMTSPPAVTYTGTCPANVPSTDTATATATATEPTSEKKDSSGCNLSPDRAAHTLGPWTIALASLLLVVLRRRRR